MTTDWNTVTSDLQRAANNLVWFVLESMTVPDQPPAVMSTMLLPAPPTITLDPNEDASKTGQVNNEDIVKKKKVVKQPKRLAKTSIGHAVDRLVSETLV